MRFRGITHITGEHDTGKTLMAIGATHPKATVFFHNDVKAPGIDPKKFGQYIDLIEKKLTYLQTMNFVLEFIDKLKPGEYEGIVFDTWTRIGAAIGIYGKLNATKFRENATMATGQIYRWGQEWAEGRWHEASIISQLNNLAPYVALTTHLKDHYLSGSKTGKQVPDCSETLDRVCNLRVWLRHNQNSGVPIALVLKRPSLTKVTENGLEVIDYLPRRLCPQDKDRSVWDVIDWYRKNGIQRSEDEKPTLFELSILDGILTNDQKEVWRANQLEQQRQEKAEAELENNQLEIVKMRIAEIKDKSLPIIQAEIEAEFGNGYDMGTVYKLLQEAKDD